MKQIGFALEVGSTNGKDEMKQWKLCRKLGSSCTFEQTKERLRRISVTSMSFDGS
jgi:hypothetical protein